jgi:hypothetical protein
MSQLDFSNARSPYKWQELNYLEYENEIGIDSFKTLIASQENALIETNRKFQHQLIEDQDLRELGTSYYYAYYQSEELAIKELELQQRYAICLSLFSYFEGRINNICNKIHQEFQFKISIKDLRKKDDDISNYINYLEKVYGMDVSKITNASKPIISQKIIRNAIAHHGGYVPKGEAHFLSNIQGLKILECGGERQVKIADVIFFEKLFELIRIFFDILLTSIDIRYEELKFPKSDDLPF